MFFYFLFSLFNCFVFCFFFLFAALLLLLGGSLLVTCVRVCVRASVRVYLFTFKCVALNGICFEYVLSAIDRQINRYTAASSHNTRCTRIICWLIFLSFSFFFFYFLSFLFLFSFFCVPVRIAFLHFTSRLACAAAAAAASPRWGEFRLCAACELWALCGHFHQARESADRRERELARESSERELATFSPWPM